MNEKTCEYCRNLITVTTARGDVWYECLFAYPEIPDVELKDTCKRWTKINYEEKKGGNGE